MDNIVSLHLDATAGPNATISSRQSTNVKRPARVRTNARALNLPAASTRAAKPAWCVTQRSAVCHPHVIVMQRPVTLYALMTVVAAPVSPRTATTHPVAGAIRTAWTTKSALKVCARKMQSPTVGPRLNARPAASVSSSKSAPAARPATLKTSPVNALRDLLFRSDAKHSKRAHLGHAR